VVEVALAEPARGPRARAELAKQPAEALGREGRLGDLAASEGGPQLRVDALVGGDGGRRAGQAQAAEGQLQRPALGPVEIEKGVVDVEEDGAEAVQAATWRGR
jgi:hypothetical protein